MTGKVYKRDKKWRVTIEIFRKIPGGFGSYPTRKVFTVVALSRDAAWDIGRKRAAAYNKTHKSQADVHGVSLKPV